MNRRHCLTGLISSPALLAQPLQPVSVEPILYPSDGLQVRGYVVAPRTEGRYPCVIYNRGGNREFGALRRRFVTNALGRIAAAGYVVVASQYRGNLGGEGAEEFGGADVNDVLNLIPFLEAHPKADASRIGMYGWSRGGMMTYLALARTTRVAAAIVGGGSADQFLELQARPEMEKDVFAQLIPDYYSNRERELKARSAVYWPEKLCKQTPLLLMHGSSDWRVQPQSALAMAQSLYKVKHPFRFVFFEGGDHELSEYRDEVNRLVLEWLDSYVRDRKPWPSLTPHGA